MLGSCKDTVATPNGNNSNSNVFYSEDFRPQYHFTPKQNWMNDPNGLVYHNGEYHLFYQYNPKGNKWGHMSWGHAVSKDLVFWEELPVALEEENGVMIFSGSVVVDKENTSGLCANGPCMVAIYTGHEEGKVQHQDIAASQDNGRTWQKYKGNPVIDIQKKDFRDPKVFWHQATQKWVMSVALPDEHKIQLYGSENLINWNKLSEFGPMGGVDRVWECPDLFPVKVDNERGGYKWVMLVSGPSAHGPEFVGMQYFMGDFDGQKFTPDSDQYPLYLDYGKDFYAGVTFNNEPYDNRIMIGWMNNWKYGQALPTSPWKGTMSVPRTLSARKMTDGKYRLIQTPLASLAKLRNQTTQFAINNVPIGKKAFLDNNFTQTKSMELNATIENIGASEFGFKVFIGDREETIIGYDVAKEELFIDRVVSSKKTPFEPSFPSRDAMPYKINQGHVKLHIFLDQSTIEVFVDDGLRTMSALAFPTNKETKIQAYAVGGSLRLSPVELWEMDGIWNRK